MSTAIIITLCVLLLIAYLFDISSIKTKIPSVILLLLLGWGVRQGTRIFDITIPDLNPILPFLGTIGLILIVLEGSLELELDKSKYNLILKSSLIALIPMILLSLGLAYAFEYFNHIPFKIGLLNAVPFAVISSAIAIPSAKYLQKINKEYITYESSLSDIYGIIFFNFISINKSFDFSSIVYFFNDLLIIFVVTFVATVALVYLLGKLKHQVKFVPIIILVILIYSISKVFHLPALIFIVLFGLLLGNIDKLKNYKFIQRFHPEILEKEVTKLRELTTEMTFLIRALFFLLFGYLIETSELLNLHTLLWSVCITAAIFILRAIHLKLFRLPIIPLLFIAPRGLITILLFLSIPLSGSISLANRSVIIQVIILTALIMMYGLINTKNVRELKPL